MLKKIDTTHQEEPKHNVLPWKRKQAKRAIGKKGSEAPALDGTGSGFCTACERVRPSSDFARQSGMTCRRCRNKQEKPALRVKTLADLENL